MRPGAGGSGREGRALCREMMGFASLNPSYGDAMRRIYAVGDIHGSLGKLQHLVARCEEDAGGRPMTFVFLGDYIDRGPQSRGVVEYLIGSNRGCRGT